MGDVNGVVGETFVVAAHQHEIDRGGDGFAAGFLDDGGQQGACNSFIVSPWPGEAGGVGGITCGQHRGGGGGHRDRGRAHAREDRPHGVR
ncbi:hypothetical protein [Nocardia gipuzkoensis]|uniref:hypothetical protein n=1 Tax=Nocardia gipuzkoensis TaxID=2749991 RepID=UPI0015EF6B9C|nr:hypothetical protein [Nocardia gipuzkoensis]